VNLSKQYRQEAWIARVSLFATLICYFYIVDYLSLRIAAAASHDHWRRVAEVILFAGCMGIIAYGNILYHVCLIGHYVRRANHRPAPREAVESLYDSPAPALTVIVPAYKEERRIIWQTLLSAALSEYPHKRVVLLIDNPPNATAADDIALLADTRAIPHDMQQWFAEPLKIMRTAQLDFFAREAIDEAREQALLAGLYEKAATWIDDVRRDFARGVETAQLPFAEKFFVEAMLNRPAGEHRARAAEIRTSLPTSAEITRHYARLVGLFSVEFASFERKQYVNLSHEANKAMNLNSYIALIGKSWKAHATEAGPVLLEAAQAEADFTIPPADYIDTIDADSMMTCDYVLRLVHHMEQPENTRVAVAQSPCSAFPGCTNPIERMAGAVIDVQFHTHQGYTHWDASFWVGANAMLRRAALEEIKETRVVDGKTVTIYIQDRTVIEDTESTIDLVSKGWKLYNYPERMTFSATPPDFGALLIQRRRWANGGLIILPKLFGYLWRSKKNLRLAKEMFMRINYLALTTLTCIVTFVLFFYPFNERLLSPAILWSALPVLLLYARDLKRTGYRYSDVWRVAALNLMLLPVVTGGVLKQFQQIVTHKKIPFGRTPKITGRTAAPAFYCLLEMGLAANFLMMSLHYALVEKWPQFGFALLNAFMFTYALLAYIGPRAVWEDVLAGLHGTLRRTSMRRGVTITAPAGLINVQTPDPSASIVQPRNDNHLPQMPANPVGVADAQSPSAPSDPAPSSQIG
jgi:cellulose synthase/poly-beta-1,6-N-acetylglucosamine synthase-like glycosyltransferase